MAVQRVRPKMRVYIVRPGHPPTSQCDGAAGVMPNQGKAPDERGFGQGPRARVASALNVSTAEDGILTMYANRRREYKAQDSLGGRGNSAGSASSGDGNCNRAALMWWGTPCARAVYWVELYATRTAPRPQANNDPSCV